MDADEIQRRLAALGQPSFRPVVGLILRKVFSFECVNVDSSGDGGSDWRAWDQGGQRLRIAIQDTVQQQNWEDKALEDARKAKAELDVNRYLFFTNRPHHQTTAVQLEERILRETGLSAQVLEATAISRFIAERNLQSDFLAALGEKVAARPPEMPEICLCAYTNLSADRRNHRDEIYNDTLLVACRDAPQAPARDELVDTALKLLSAAPSQRGLLEKRLQVLMSQQQIRQRADQRLELTAQSKARIDATEHLYLSDWAVLESDQARLMDTYGANWDSDDARHTAVLVARMFLKNQLELLRHARVESLAANWSARLGNPEQQLRDLLQTRGIPVRKLHEAIAELVKIAKDHDVISKLTRTVVFVALEGRDPMISAAALGCRGWDEVSVLLDSSVAIPFLCEKLHGEIRDYFFSMSGHAIALFQSLGSPSHILPGHIEECAGHLVLASRYEPLEREEGLAASLRASENAFVSFYHSLRASPKGTSQSLSAFLQTFSRRAGSATRRITNPREAAKSLMPDLQELLRCYHVNAKSLRHPPVDRFHRLQKAFDKACMESGKDRIPILREHDVDALAHLAATTEQKGESCMMLTWDKTLIQVAHAEIPSAFVATPEMAMDFAQPCRSLSDTQWSALAHRLAIATPAVDRLTAKIIDRVAYLNPGKLEDSRFREELIRFREEARERAPDPQSDRYHQWIEQQTDKFLESHSIRTQGNSPSKT